VVSSAQLGFGFSVEHIPHECKDQQYTVLSLTVIKLNVWKSAEVWRVYGRRSLAGSDTDHDDVWEMCRLVRSLKPVDDGALAESLNVAKDITVAGDSANEIGILQ